MLRQEKPLTAGFTASIITLTWFNSMLSSQILMP